ncbi:MAG: glycosyltransferase family 2 protein [Magnetococcales bacterium]|nr:glycosyltransferase family 2 protein [Magnetococcales bacterium]
MNPDVAVILVAHRDYATLELAVTGFCDLVAARRQVVFVDNGSADGLGNRLKRRFPEITVLRLERNLHYCGGNNAGLRWAMEQGFPFALVVNPDTEVVETGFIDTLMESAARWPRVAFFGPLVWYRERGRPQNTIFPFPNLSHYLLSWLPEHTWRQHKKIVVPNEGNCDFLNGVCVLVRLAALRDFGLLDEVMGGYVEDGDWAYRARQRGWLSRYVPIESVIHHEELTGYAHHDLKSFMLKRNTVYWFLKHGKPFSARFYAAASELLARLRLWEAGPEEKPLYAHFLNRLKAVHRHLLRGEEPGDWFGPPLGSWQPPRRGGAP